MEPTPFVGRAEEFERLERALRRVQSGVGSTVLVAGEAGIGKTRLASELTTRARDAGFEVLVGRCIDLIGTELPYQPFAEALRPLGRAAAGVAGRRRLAAAGVRGDARAPQRPRRRRARAARARGSALGRYVDARSRRLPRAQPRRPAVLLLATYRADELSSAERMRRLADGVRRSGSALELELGPLEREELTALLAARARRAAADSVTDAIVARSEGNPFFAEELLAAAGDQDSELPRSLRDLLLQRVARLDRRTQGVLRARRCRRARRRTTRCCATRPRSPSRACASLCARPSIMASSSPIRRRGSFRFRHALLAEAIYATILPGEREELHARLADELARSGAASPAELAPHWEAAGRTAEALVASVEAAREAEAVFGLAEALAHLERALALWPAVPDAAALAASTSSSSRRGRPSSPSKPTPPRAPSNSAGEPSRSSATTIRCAPRSCTSASATTCSQPAAATPASLRASAQSSSCRRSRPRRSARTRWRRSGMD